MGHPLTHKDHKARAVQLSGGHLQLPKTPAQRVRLIAVQRRLKAEFLRRQAGRG